MLLSSAQEVQSPLYGTLGLAQGPEDAALLWVSGAAPSNARGTHMAPAPHLLGLLCSVCLSSGLTLSHRTTFT